VKQSIQVTILGQQYTIRSASPPEQIGQVAAYVNDQLSRTAAVAPTADTLHITVLTLLNIAGSYLQLRDSGGHLAMGDRERLEALLGRLEQATSGQG